MSPKFSFAAADSDLVSEFDVNAHELGHAWFQQSYPWAAQASGRYGTSGADWLDEISGILMEDSLLSENRRSLLMTYYRTRKELIRSLDTLFTMEHAGSGNGKVVEDVISRAIRNRGAVPIDDAIRSALEGARQEIVQGAVKSLQRSPGFYEQCRGLIDFLVERTGDPAIFGAIAANEASGSSMAEWLQANGSRYNLPTTVGDLDKEWQDWLAQQSRQRP